MLKHIKYIENKDLFGSYLVGLVEADGCIVVPNTELRKNKNILL